MYSQVKKKNKFLSNVNPFLLLGTIYLLILVRTTMDPLGFRFFRGWDLLLPFVVYFGQRRSFLEGVSLTLVTGHFYSLASSAPMGTFVISYLVLFFSARLLSYVFYAEGLRSITSLMVGVVILSRISLSVVSNTLGVGWTVWDGGWLELGKIFFNSLMGVCIYWALSIFDNLTGKVPRIPLEVRA